MIEHNLKTTGVHTNGENLEFVQKSNSDVIDNRNSDVIQTRDDLMDAIDLGLILMGK